MISYHLDPPLSVASGYASGFKIADINDVDRLARGISSYVWSPCIWQDGRRRQENFLRADWCVLDFDSPEMSLDQACRIFCDTVHIVGTTRNHQKEKHGVTCDRFRVMIRFSTSITALADYRHTMATVLERYPADPAPKDGARFFYPCTRIVSSASEGFTEPVLVAPTRDELAAAARHFNRQAQHRRYGTLPPWVKDFLVKGKLCKSQGRSNSVYAVARAMAELGRPLEEVLSRIAAAPIDRREFEDSELLAAAKNGFKKGMTS